MKKLIFFFLISLVFAACKSNDPKEPFKIAALTTVNIKPEAAAWKAPAMRIKSELGHLSAIDIVKQTTVMQFYNYKLGIGDGKFERMFDKLQRDTLSSTPALKMWATDIITEKGEYTPEFIEGKDIILIHFHEMTPTTARDTIGYIPNAVMRSAEASIKVAYEARDLDEVLRLFNEAFTFRPISGAEYKALKAQGNN